MGQRCIEMHFLPDVWVECENCHGRRYIPETLEVQYRGQSIADVLSMRVADALALFESVPKVRRMLQTLDDVGLGYVQLGQSAPTLSAGEAQRVKLAAELGRPATGKTLYILDEPTTGLHFDDLKKLLEVLHRLVDLGNTCVCIEHNLDVIKTADWVIDLGPEAGEHGGTVVAAATPETLAETPESHTGAALKAVLAAGPVEARHAFDMTRQTLHEMALAGPIDLGKDVKMPWERNGKAWHTVDHVDHQGVPVEWDPRLPVWLVNTVESLGSFAPTDWKHRSRIEVKAPGDQPWFCHLLTGGKDLLEVAIRTQQGTFHPRALRSRLRLKTLDERPDLPIYGQWNRIRLRTSHLGWQDVRLFVRDFHDVNRTAYRSFLKEAANAYFAQLEKVRAEPGRARPWEAGGKQWHLSQESIRRRHLALWKPPLLLAIVGRLKSMEPSLNFNWNSKTAVQFTMPDHTRPTGKIVTNLGRGLRVELHAPRNALTFVQVDRLGEDVQIKPQRNYDRIVFWIRSLAQNDARQLRSAWKRCRSEREREEGP